MQGRTKGKKVVENYQIIETLEEYENDCTLLSKQTISCWPGT
jgi:hypothetical protein